MTLEASREIVLQMTAPQPSSNALPMTFAFVPGGPEPMTKGLGSFSPSTVVSSVAIRTLRSGITRFAVDLDAAAADHEDCVQHERGGEGDEPGVSIDAIQ